MTTPQKRLKQDRPYTQAAGLSCSFALWENAFYKAKNNQVENLTRKSVFSSQKRKRGIAGVQN